MKCLIYNLFFEVENVIEKINLPLKDQRKAVKAILQLIRRLCCETVCVLVILYLPLPLCALLSFAASRSHLHLKTCAPLASNKANREDTVGLYVKVKVAIISRKEQKMGGSSSMSCRDVHRYGLMLPRQQPVCHFCLTCPSGESESFFSFFYCGRINMISPQLVPFSSLEQQPLQMSVHVPDVL